jgi:hypothetical protein
MIEAMPMLLKLEPHLHSMHSDGQDDVRSMFEACRQAGYDAVALTDHNTLAGMPEARAAAEALGLVLIEGVEVTTFHGHLVALGVTRVPEWRHLEDVGVDALVAEVHAQGGVVSIAHPGRLGSPACSGCAWEWPVDPRQVDLWEVFSAPQPEYPHPELALRLWQEHLRQGGRAAPIAAGDLHSVEAARRLRALTYVQVRERSAAGVLEGLREGRVFASRGKILDRQTPGVSVQSLQTVHGRCDYVELRAADGSLEAVSAPTWMDSRTTGETSV